MGSLRTLPHELAIRTLSPSVRKTLKFWLRWPRARWGNLRRREPFSSNYGLERGTPVDRIYIEDFLARHATDVRGRTLEVKNANYTKRFGGANVACADVLDIDASNTNATVVADLGVPGSLPENVYDCFILTQTLQLVPDYETALRNSFAALRQEGVLLVTVPAVAFWNAQINDLWRWTPAGFEVELTRCLPDAAVEVEGHGTVSASIAVLHGLVAEEMTDGDLVPSDPRYPVIVTARVTKL